MATDALHPRRIAIPAELAGERLDLALVRLVPGVSRARIQELIKDGGVRVDGVVATRAAQPLAAGGTLEILAVARTRERAGGEAAGELAVVFEDDDLAVIDKPAGTLAHPTSVVRGGTLSELATRRWGELPAPQGADRPGIVHRLDADTSGLIVVAKSALAAERLVELFRARAVEKGYLALVAGEPRFDSDWIERPLGRSSQRPDRMTVLPEGGGRPAQTFYRTLERRRGFALLECWPKTGRTHQIRVHLAAIGHPLVGDRVYPGRVRRPLPADAPRLARHALHAHVLRFAHPVSGAPLAFELPLAADLQRFLDWMRAGTAPLI